MSEPVQQVGFIGLGPMGAAIARNILKAGFALTVYNRTATKMRSFLDAGAKGAASPAEAGRCHESLTGVELPTATNSEKQRSQNGPPTHGN